jgi:transcriptional regulator with XRE-family HTH domain
MEGTLMDTRPGASRRGKPTQNGPAIRALREKDGWTQTAFAKAVGIRQASLSNIESETSNATIATLNLIARRLRVPLDAIMRDRDEGRPEEVGPVGTAAA